MQNIIAYIKQRIAEPSTHAALAALTLVLPAVVPPAYQPLLPFATAIFAALGIVLPDASSLTPASVAAFIPPVKIASSPALADAINVGVSAGVQAAVSKLLTPPKPL